MTKRLILATVLSPLALFPAMAIYMLTIVLGSGGLSTGGVMAGIGSGLLLGGFGLFFGLLGATLLLLPGALALRRFGLARAWTMAALGLVAGLALGVWEGGGLAYLMYGLSGSGVGLAFGLMAGPALRRTRTPTS